MPQFETQRSPKRRVRQHVPRAEQEARMVWDPECELDLLRHFCRLSFWDFFLYGFGAGLNPKNQRWIDEAVHKPIADWYESHIREWLDWRANGIIRQKNLAIIVHREVGKTTELTQAGQAWLHLLDPEISTYTGSEKLEMAADMIEPIKSVLDGSDPYALWSLMYGNWATSAKTWKGGKVVHSGRKNTGRRDPSLGTFGVETSIVGSHPDAIFYDDPISYDRLKTDIHWMGAVNEQVTSLIPVLQADGLRVWMGTRYASSDHFGTSLDLIENGGDGVASISGMQTDSFTVEPDGQWHIYYMSGRDQNDCTKDHPEGRPTTPKVWPEARLRDFKRNNSLRYAAQVLNDPSLSDTNPITKDQLRQCVVQSKDVPWHALSFAIILDLALWDGKQKINKDETVFQVVGYPGDGSGLAYYVEGHGSQTWTSRDLGDRLVNIVQRYRSQGRRIKGIGWEVSMSGLKGVWLSQLRNYFNDSNVRCPAMYEWERHGQQKIQRITARTDLWLNGFVKLVEEAPGLARLMDQMSRIGEMQVAANTGKKLSRKDDWVDVMADWFQPQFYQTMRRPEERKAFIPGARAIETEGFDHRMFDDDTERAWLAENPRPPLR
jgi:hypothetical protein